MVPNSCTTALKALPKFLSNANCGRGKQKHYYKGWLKRPVSFYLSAVVVCICQINSASVYAQSEQQKKQKKPRYTRCVPGEHAFDQSGNQARPKYKLPFATAFPASVYPDESLKDSVELSADSAESDPLNPEQILLNGTIAIKNRDGALKAESARFNPTTNIATVEGKLNYESAGLQVDSSDATIDVEQGTFDIGESGYEVTNGNVVSQGRASGIERDDSGQLKLNEATYTSCPPGDNGWLITADRIKLNPDKGVGFARNITLRFKNVPIFYAPAFSFPISNQRKSGFLAPRFDRNDQTGLEIRQPYYWNIRPNWDATFVLRAMTERGLQLQSELRHLNRIGTWTLNHEFISNDDRFESGVDRTFTRFRHNGGFSSRWSTSIDVSDVSDSDYFDDLGDTLSVASITHLKRVADLVYTAPYYEFRTRFLDYQTVVEDIAPDDLPFQKLPQLTLNYAKPLGTRGFKTVADTELVFFQRSNSVTGSRFDVQPRLEWNINRAAWFSSLAASVRHTRYDLTDGSDTRTVPVLSADVGTFLDRYNENDGSLLTLEPRVFYLFARRTNQDDLPVFDTATLDFNFSQLFRENQFSGADRINDANQLSFALSSRLINEDGRERFRAAVGQIFYFQDRLVTLPDGEPDFTTSSDLVGEVEMQFNRRWSADSTIEWNPNTSSTDRSSTQISYRDGADRVANLGHRLVSDEGEFIHASIAWPIRDRWRLAGAWNYSLDNEQSIETVFGLEYQSCCWAFRAAARRFITDNGDENTNAFFFQLVLKGLAPLGQNVTGVLRESIGGYSPSDR